MKITEKVQRRLRNVFITLTIICLTPLCEKGRILNGAQSVNAFAGQEILCVLDLGNEMYGSHGLEAGLNYRLVNEFAAASHCNVTVISAGKDDNYLDSLRLGKADIVITHDCDLDGLQTLYRLNDCSWWVMADSDHEKSSQINFWIANMKASGRLQKLQTLYSTSSNPHKRAERGITSSVICPYDEIIKRHSKRLGWDWRMVAAVVYQESKFSICSSSPRGAQGLMQVMPGTGRYYGVENLLDSEQNIIAGTSHLKRLQKLFSKYDLEQEELTKFTLAAYNAGEGRIMDCRNLAESKGFDNGKWENIVKVIPMMRDDSILEDGAVKLGKFQGHETIDYIDNVMSHYRAICQICPTSF